MPNRIALFIGLAGALAPGDGDRRRCEIAQGFERRRAGQRLHRE